MDNRELLRAAVSEEWQPIETAPKDTAVLVYGFGYSVAHFNTAYGKWIVYGAETECTRMMNTMSRPTHWMPLPQEPSCDSSSASPAKDG